VIRARRTIAKAFAKDAFFNQERKLGDRRGLDTLVVSTINCADCGCVVLLTGTRGRELVSVPHDTMRTLREIKVFGFRGEYGRKTET
jgi:hypothetical protein